MKSPLAPDSPQHGLRPIVSICIANYNGIGMLDGCIKSVRSQDCEFPIEIIVHDDASSDGSVDHIRERHPDVLLIESPENVGFCVANNRMAAAASGEYLLLLNNDAELFPDALRALFAEAKNTPKPAILGLPQFDFDTGELIDRGSLVDLFLNPVPNLDASRRDVAMIMGSCLWIPRDLWIDLDGFPEWFGSIAEDLHLCSKARVKDYPVRVLDQSGYRHRVGQSFGGGKITGSGGLVTTTVRRAYTERNKTYSLVITTPTALLCVILPLHLFLLHLEGLLLALFKRDATLFRDIYGPLLPSLWRQRARISNDRFKLQAERQISLMTFLAPIQFLPYKLLMLYRHGLPKVQNN